MRRHAFAPLAVLAALLLPAAPAAPGQAAPPRAPAAPARWKADPPKELFAIERVIDGDTIHVRRNGGVQKLRLACVDTEEKASTSTGDPTKPSTVFGEECAQWAARYLDGLEPEGRPDRIGLLFPGGREDLDAYGRLLCHVILPDGTDFNLMLVGLGKSPYFNKYGNDLVCHEAFLQAQREARAAMRGIWDPAVNTPKTPGAPAAKRPYDELLPWWDARAAAIDEYRERVAADPDHVASAEEPDELARVLETSRKGADVEVLGQVDRLFDEDDGSLTVLLRSGSPQEAKAGALRLRIAAERREAFAPLELRRRSEPFRQNYLWIRGRVERGSRGFELRADDPARIRAAGPEPAASGSRR
jgi:endonuclease YncB( thermonuclease family)